MRLGGSAPACGSRPCRGGGGGGSGRGGDSGTADAGGVAAGGGSGSATAEVGGSAPSRAGASSQSACANAGATASRAAEAIPANTRRFIPRAMLAMLGGDGTTGACVKPWRVPHARRLSWAVLRPVGDRSGNRLPRRPLRRSVLRRVAGGFLPAGKSPPTLAAILRRAAAPAPRFAGGFRAPAPQSRSDPAQLPAPGD
jgi:hypothetical protein